MSHAMMTPQVLVIRVWWWGWGWGGGGGGGGGQWWWYGIYWGCYWQYDLRIFRRLI